MFSRLASLGFFALLGIFLLPFILMTYWTDRNLDFWLSHFKGSPVDVNAFWAFLAVLFGGPVTFILDLLGEIFRAVM